MLASRSWRLTRPLRAGRGHSRATACAVGGRDPSDTQLEAHVRRRLVRPRRTARRARRGASRDYLARGWREGRDPSPLLDGAWYVARVPRPADGDRARSKTSSRHSVRPAPEPVVRPDRLATRFRIGRARTSSRIWAGLAVAPTTRSDGLGDGDCLEGVQAIELDDGCAACVFVHYDPEGTFDPHVVVDARRARALRAPRRRLHDVPDARRADAASPPRARRVRVLSVPNTGYDWGRTTPVSASSSSECDPGSVTFMNDSVYVIDDALAPFLERVDGSPADVVGATDSLMFRYHLQSYFLHLRRSALDEPADERVPRDVRPGIGQALRHQRVRDRLLATGARARARARCRLPVRFLVAARGAPRSPAPSSHRTRRSSCGTSLLERGFPFVKATYCAS